MPVTLLHEGPSCPLPVGVGADTTKPATLHERDGLLAATRPFAYFTRRSTVTQLLTPEPPTLNVTPTFGVFLVGASPMGSSMSCL